MVNNAEQKFDIEDPRNIWVSSDSDGSEAGTYENPFSSVSEALKKAACGQNVIMMPGVYTGDETIETSGSIKQPIRIAASGAVIIERGCWYFYDTSDLIVSGLTFRNSPHGAISVVGSCLRNRFHGIEFIDCGTAGKASCTFYFGGSGARFNLVENCSFIRSSMSGGDELCAQSAVVGLMVSDGDKDNPLANHIIRRNRFCNYDKAIILGAGSIGDFESGHIVEYNRIENCSSEGIVVRCGDVQIRGNFISGCGRSGVALAAGSYSIIESNRISGCSQGITVNGEGHTVSGCCFSKCQFSAVTACGVSEDSQAAANLFIHENTIVNCGCADNGSGVIIEAGASCIIQKNLFYGSAAAYSFQSSDDERYFGAGSCAPNLRTKGHLSVISGNIASKGSRQLDGVSIGDIEFGKFSDDNYENESGCGASGWALSADAFDKHSDGAVSAEENYADAYQFEDEDGEPVIFGESDGDDVFGTFFPEELDRAARDE